eukprot:15468697-Alexandrium_andersonii.AAC.1
MRNPRKGLESVDIERTLRHRRLMADALRFAQCVWPAGVRIAEWILRPSWPTGQKSSGYGDCPHLAVWRTS